MSGSGVGGLISVASLLIFSVALIFCHHYWQEQKRSGTGQRKKRRLRKIMRRWVFAVIGSAVVALAGAAVYYLAPQPSEKQYVLISNPNVELAAGEPVGLTIDIENGPGEVTVGFHNVTPKFRGRSNEKILTYVPDHLGSPVKKLTPHQQAYLRWQFNNLVLTQEQINDLNSKTPDGQLFFFARVEWIDEEGIKHPLPFCYQHTTKFPNRLMNCADDIKFR